MRIAWFLRMWRLGSKGGRLEEMDLRMIGRDNIETCGTEQDRPDGRTIIKRK